MRFASGLPTQHANSFGPWENCDYLNGMPYLCCLPGLLCGIAACVTDLRRRTVPRRLIMAGIATQLLACALLAW
ncbi:MAG: hypothetical protein K2I40_01820, partial [Bifidobacterium castoris]|nr:hypothetical protein [Bifidobacterium castoris]